MGQFPNDIAIDQPVPGKTRFDHPPLFKKAYAESNGGDGKEPGKKPVEHKNQEGHFVFFYFESFVHNRPYDLDE